MDIKLKTAGDIDQLLSISLSSAALSAALELGLFWRLLDGAQTADRISQEFGIPPLRCQHWLALLAGMGLLERDGETYALSPIATTAITDAREQETWRLLAVEAREAYPAGTDLATQIRHPGSVWESQGRATPDYVAKMATDPSRARRFTRMLYDLHRPLAQELARTLDLSNCRRLLDLGGGSGVISLELLKGHPQLTAVVVDIENVCIAGREIAAAVPEGPRIEYQPTDFLSDELPSGFDMVLECDVGIHSAPLYRNVRSCLNDEGRFVIVDKLPQAELPATLTGLKEAFYGSLMDPEFRQQTVQDIYEYLSQTGFLPGSAQSLSYGRWWVIHAQPNGSEA